ncbi:hypothetical protein KC351_g654 [Hortaea werneckii]|nr:hypothetical protein KC351_g654 [Hortaea werneckii]
MSSAKPSRGRVRFDVASVEPTLPERGTQTCPISSEDARTFANTSLGLPHAESSRQQGDNDISDLDLQRILSLLNIEACELNHIMFRALEFLNPDSSPWRIVDPSFVDTFNFNALPEKKYRGLKPSRSKVVLPIYFHQEAHFGIAILDLAKSQLDLFEPLQSQKLYERMGSVTKAFVKCLAASNCFEGRTKPKKERYETRSNTRLVQQNKVDCALYCVVNTLAEIFSQPLPTDVNAQAWRAWLAFAFDKAKAAKIPPETHSSGLGYACDVPFEPFAIGAMSTVVAVNCPRRRSGKIGYLFADGRACLGGNVGMQCAAKDDETTSMVDHPATIHTCEATTRLVCQLGEYVANMTPLPPINIMIAKDKKNQVEARPELAQKVGVQLIIALESANVADKDENRGSARHVELVGLVGVFQMQVRHGLKVDSLGGVKK